MSTFLLQLLIPLLLPASLLLLHLHRPRPKPPIIIIRDLHLARQHLSAPSETLTPLASRALPNQRLVTAFSINNSFTTSNMARHKEFKSSVERRLKQTPSQWAETASLAVSLLPTPPPADFAPVPFLREYVLTVVLRLLFPGKYMGAGGRHVAELGNLINDLWVQSKGRVRPSARDKRRLEAVLGMVFDHGVYGNPLDIILPAYETLWRVVLRCFLEVQVRGRGKVWRELLGEYLASGASAEQFAAVREGVSVAFIVKETLRLYPPTKRVYRAFTEEGDDWVAIDVEWLHCDPGAWGEDVGVFRPERWGVLGAAGESAGWMPFGAGTFVCPAKGEFAPRLIGILVAALLGMVPEDAGWEAGKKEDEVLAEGRLNNGRGGYGTLTFRW